MSKILEDLVRCGVPSETIIAVARLEADAELTQKRREKSREWAKGRRRGEGREKVGEKEGSAAPPPAKEKKAKKRMLEADFVPDRTFAQAKGWSERTIDLEISRFRDHARATGRRQLDWEAAWRNWVTSPFQTNGGGNGRRPEPRKGSREDRQERTSYAVAKLSDYPLFRGDYQGGRGRDDAVPPVGLPLPEPD